MTIVLPLGMLFWTAMVFVGTRKVFQEGEKPVCEVFRSLRKGPLLAILGGVLLLLGVGASCLEVSNVSQMGGSVGGYFFLSVIGGVSGAMCISAQLYLKD